MKKGHRFKNSVLFRLFCCKTLALMAVYLFFRRFLGWYRVNGDTDKDEKWTAIIGGMTIYKDAELKTYLEQAGFHDVQIHKKKSWLCITARK